jgi:uncharacterized protein YeaO (DUF488 family)
MVKDIFQIKRIYDNPSDDDGYRILVDRIWPRGISKKNANLDEWNKEIAPSTELRKWFDHKEGRFDEFARLYREELVTKTKELNRLKALAKTEVVTLLYGAKDPAINHAVVLKDLLMR